MGCLNDMRTLGIAESCSLDSNPSVALEGFSLHLRTNMLPLSIAVRPYEENARILSLLLDVLRNAFLVLIDSDLGGSFEELAWLTRSPSFESMIKVEASEVTQDAGHDNGAVSPWPEIELELVVLHIWITLDASSTDVAASEVLGDRLGDGRLLRHAEDLLWHRALCLRDCIDGRIVL